MQRCHESGILVLVWKKLKVVVIDAERKNICEKGNLRKSQIKKNKSKCLQ